MLTVTYERILLKYIYTYTYSTLHELSGWAEVVAEALVVVEEERTLEVVTGALDVLEEAEDFGVDEAGAGASAEPPGLTMEVVMSPLSMYTPEKFQSSVEPSFVRRRTPKCQSAPLESVEAEIGPAVFFRASAPVEW